MLLVRCHFFLLTSFSKTHEVVSIFEGRECFVTCFLPTHLARSYTKQLLTYTMLMRAAGRAGTLNRRSHTVRFLMPLGVLW